MNRVQPDTILPKEPKVRVYVALLTQTGTNAPIPTILTNTTNLDITWTREGGGQYLATLNDYDPITFDIQRSCAIYTTPTNFATVIEAKEWTIGGSDNNVIAINVCGGGTGYEDGALNKATFRLEIYTDTI